MQMVQVFSFQKNDKLSLEEQLAGITKPSTQYGRMMDCLVVELIHAGSSQAKWRVERLWNTLHDRLRTENGIKLYLYQIQIIKASNLTIL